MEKLTDHSKVKFTLTAKLLRPQRAATQARPQLSVSFWGVHSQLGKYGTNWHYIVHVCPSNNWQLQVKGKKCIADHIAGIMQSDQMKFATWLTTSLPRPVVHPSLHWEGIHSLESQNADRWTRRIWRRLHSKPAADNWTSLSHITDPYWSIKNSIRCSCKSQWLNGLVQDR